MHTIIFTSTDLLLKQHILSVFLEKDNSLMPPLSTGQQIKALLEERETLAVQRQALRGNLFNRAIAAFVSWIIPLYKVLVYLALPLLFVEFLILVGAMRGFSTRPKAADTDAVGAVGLAILVTITVVVIPTLLLVYATQKTSLNPDTQNRLKNLDALIAANEAKIEQAQRTYSKAKNTLVPPLKEKRH